MKTKTFDCVHMKRQGAQQVMKRLEGMTVAEQLTYWQKATEDLKTHQRNLQKNRRHPKIGDCP